MYFLAVPIEVKSGKDYTVHSALNTFVSNEDYHIKKAFVLSNERTVTSDGKTNYKNQCQNRNNPLRKGFLLSQRAGSTNRNLYCNHFFFNSRIFFSICCITPLKSSSVFPVGSSSFQLSSNALPINGQPTSQPMEKSGSGMLDISLDYCFFSMSMP